MHNTLEIGVYVFFYLIKQHSKFFCYIPERCSIYMHPLWLYKHQHDNGVRSTQNAFSLPFAAILVNCAPSGEMHNYCTPHIIKENYENFLIHHCNYILLSQVYCVWQVVKTSTVILNKKKKLYKKKKLCSCWMCYACLCLAAVLSTV